MGKDTSEKRGLRRMLCWEEGGRSRRLELDGLAVVSLGAHPANDLVLQGKEVEPVHAALFLEGSGQRLLQDLGTHRPCRVNGKEVRCHLLEPGDEITLGDWILHYVEMVVQGKGRALGLSDRDPLRVEKLRTGAEDGRARALERLEHLRLLYEVAHRIQGLADAGEALNEALAWLHQRFDADRTWLARLREGGTQLELIASLPDDDENAPVSRTMLHRLLAERRPLVATDLGSDERFFTGRGLSDSVRGYPFRSLVWLPLLVNGEVAGLFCLEWRRDNRGENDDDLLVALSLELGRSFQRFLDQEALQERLAVLEASVAEEEAGRTPVGISKTLHSLAAQARSIAGHDGTVLITGPTGSGKQVIAEFIHAASTRNRQPFIQVNCAGIPDTMLESELFGVVAGYPGLHNREALPGKLARAEGGTLFLDEIGDMPPALQAKLLLVLEQKRFCPLGGAEQRMDVKIIAASNQDLERAMREGRFREDLYERLNIFRLSLPFLSKRSEDIPLLAGFFLHRLRRQNNRKILGFAPKSMELLRSYSWPRNVRELHNQIVRAFHTAKGPLIQPKDLELAGKKEAVLTLTEIEREHIRRVLQVTGMKMEPAARLLGIAKQTLYNKCKEHGLRPEEEK